MHSNKSIGSTEELGLIENNIQNLHSLLNYYEQKASQNLREDKINTILDYDELSYIWDDANERMSVPFLIKYLNTIVCQSSLHLMQKQCSLAQQQQQHENLTEKVEYLEKLVGDRKASHSPSHEDSMERNGSKIKLDDHSRCISANDSEITKVLDSSFRWPQATPRVTHL